MSRPRSALIALAMLTSLALVTSTLGCGGGDGNDPPDAGPQGVDAPPAPPDAMAPVDAPPGPYQGLGQTCTGAGQGDCPNGFECLPLAGGSVASWCTMRCTGQTDPVCANGYTGPGVASCFLSVDENNDGNPDFMACGVVCNDPPGAPDICPTCDGTCPGELMCLGDILDQNNNVIAQACE